MTQNNNNNQYKNLSKIFICKFNPSFLHILKCPRVLPCGNTACEECIEDSIDKNGVLKCNFEKCKQKHEIKNVDSLVKNLMVEDVLDDNLITIAEHIIGKIKRRFISFKESLSDKEQLIEKKFEFIEDEIRIRIESIRNDIDNLQTQLIDECNKIKKEFLLKLKNDMDNSEKQFQNFDDLLSLNKANSDLYDLKKNIYSCQNFIKEIQNFDNNFSQTLKKCSFIANEWTPDLSLVGRLNKKVHINFDEMKKSNLEIMNFVNTIQSVNRIYALNDDELLLSSSDDNSIVKLDNRFNEILRINSIQQHNLITPLSVCSDNFENIYICDFGNNCVLITNFDLTIIKKIIGKKSLDCGQPIEPFDICFHYDKLYVLNKDSSYVTVFTRNGDFFRQLILYAAIKPDNADNTSIGPDITLLKPNRIGTNGKTLAVLESFRRVYLYDCITGDLKQIVKSNNSTIMCLFDDYLFTCNRDGCLIGYQQNNNTNKYQQVFERTVDILKDSKSYMCYFSNKLLIALTDSKSIVAL